MEFASQVARVAPSAESLRRLAALGLFAAVGLAAPSSATAQELVPPLSETPIASCEWNYLNGPESECAPDNIPVSCITPQALVQLRHYEYEPWKRSLGIDKAVGSEAATPDNTASQEPHLEIGTEDNGAVMNNDQNRAQAVLFLGRVMGATWWRFNLDSGKFKHIRDYKRYVRAVDEAKNCGYNIQTTIGCRGRNWSAGSYAKHVKYIVGLTPGEVSRYSFCNEPNDPKLLKKINGRTLPQTARILFEAGSTAVKKTQPSAEIDGPDLSSDNYPLDFLHEMAKCMPEDSTCKPLIISHLNYHPYSFTSSPIAEPSAINWHDKKIGIDKSSLIEERTEAEFEAGRIMTPENTEPPINFDEFAYLINKLPPEIRTTYYSQVFQKLCPKIKISGVSFYQVDPNRPYSANRWNSGQNTLNGALNLSYYTISSQADRLKCIKKDSVEVIP